MITSSRTTYESIWIVLDSVWSSPIGEPDTALPSSSQRVEFGCPQGIHRWPSIASGVLLTHVADVAAERGRERSWDIGQPFG